MNLEEKKIKKNNLLRDFSKISKYFENKIGVFWWFLNMTRLDLALWGTPSKRKFKNILFSYYYLIVSLIKKLFTFQKKQNLNNKYIFIFEDFKLSKNLIHKEDYYFKKVKDFFPNYKNIIIGFKIYNDKKNFLYCN